MSIDDENYFQYRLGEGPAAFIERLKELKDRGAYYLVTVGDFEWDGAVDNDYDLDELLSMFEMDGASQAEVDSGEIPVTVELTLEE